MGKLLSEENLAQMFRDRYLDYHGECLGSIADIISTEYEGNKPDEYRAHLILMLLKPNGQLGVSAPPDSEESESEFFRNLRNAWYHEFAMRRTSVEIAPWKIIQAYYSVLCSISALVRCFYPDREEGQGHKWILDKYSELFVGNRTRGSFLLPPTSMYLQSGLKGGDSIRWAYGRETHALRIAQTFERARSALNISVHGKVTLPMYLRCLREWVNYADPYLFFRLYGESVKKRLERALNEVTFLYLTQTEHFMIRLFGWEALKLQFEAFIEQLTRKLEIPCPQLEARFAAHENMSQPRSTRDLS